ncbi:MAG TPA: M20 family metallopeptidase [Longimicrobiales bacterium]|nr:M20 family metallopeptidase [Longimicrobiales bacterium]
MADAIEAVLGETREAAARRVLARLRSYVEHESPSGDHARCAALAERIASDARTLGANANLLDAPGMGRHVRAEFAANQDAPPLLVLGHLDTVHPVGTLERQPFTTLNHRACGPGIYDMKAGVALMLEAIALLQRSGRKNARRIVLLVTCDEEIGSHTGRPHIEAAARGAHAVLVPEPSLADGSVKTSRKGVATYRLTAHGRAAHAGIEPEKGVNAVVELAHQVLALQQIAAQFADGSITVGTVSGGTATNVVPALATASVDVRFASIAAGERIDTELNKIAPRTSGARVEVERTDWRPPLERSPGVVALYERARGIAETLGMQLGEGGTGGGSDGCLTAALGVPTLDGLGPRGGGAHSVDEHVLIDDLPFRLAFYSRLLEEL